MSLTKETAIDKIEVLENSQIQVRQIVRVMEDGKELSANYHRWTLNPGDDLTDQDPKVVAVAQALWTPETIASYEAFVTQLQTSQP